MRQSDEERKAAAEEKRARKRERNAAMRFHIHKPTHHAGYQGVTARQVQRSLQKTAGKLGRRHR